MTADKDKSTSKPLAAEATNNEATAGSTHAELNKSSSASTDAQSARESEKGAHDSQATKGQGFVVIDSEPTQDVNTPDGPAAAAIPAKAAEDVSTMDNAKASTTPTGKKMKATEKTTQTTGRFASGSLSEASVRTKSSGTAAWIAGGTAVIAVLLAAGLWWQNERFEAVSREVATRLQQADQQVTKLTREVQMALSQTTSQGEQLKLLQRDFRTMRSEMLSIDQAWQSVSRTLDDRLLINYLRRLLNLSQQLVLTGQVSGAISVLESAVDMIQAHHSPEQFVALSTAIGTDLERLRAMPVVDMSELAVQLGKVVALVEKAAMQVPDRVVPGLRSIQPTVSVPTENKVTSASAVVSEADPTRAWWQAWMDTATQTAGRVMQVASREFSDLMQVRRTDTPQTLLLSEEQAMLVRTNLRSMLLGAQLALLNRQPVIWDAELVAASETLRNYYDVESTDVKTALSLLQALRESSIAIDVKPITESLSALAVVAQSFTVPATSGESH